MTQNAGAGAPPSRIAIAGIAGASLGTEIAKSLRLAGGYEIVGCDISGLAFGHYDANFDETVLVRRETYIPDLLEICTARKIDCLIAGGDEPAVLIGQHEHRFADIGVQLAQNDARLVATVSHKGRCFEALAELGFAIPQTRAIDSDDDLDDFPIPCVIKPATASGGSAGVFFARDGAEARLYAAYLRNNGKAVIAQSYLPETYGEFTVGVLSLRDGRCAGAIALQRSFQSKLSVSAKGDGFLISSGYSQGRIDAFPDLCAQAVAMATALGSTGPLNIQGRLLETGRFVPFEINPRFSASTYLRALAGFNEVDTYVKNLFGFEPSASLEVRPGWYLRTLAEVVVPLEAVVR